MSGKKTCSFDGCDRWATSKGLCEGHNWQRRKGRTLTPLKKQALPFKEGESCSAEGCSEPLKARQLCQTHYHIKYNYGLSPEQYSELLRKQGGRCPICGASEPGGKGTWHIDHDHGCCPQKGKSCGKCVRNLLCNSCNTGLGLFRDNLTVLLAAAKYLESHGKVRETTAPA